MELVGGTSYTAVAISKRRLCWPPLVEYGLMGNDGRGQSIKLIPEVDYDEEVSNQVPSMRNNPPFLKFHWEGLIKDYKDLCLSDEDHEEIHNNQLRPMLQSWVGNAQDPIHWMTFENLPMLFRFALRRPLMLEQALIKRLDEIGVMEYLPVIDKSVEDVVEAQDCHVIEEREWHVSTKYKERIPKGNALHGPLVTWVDGQPPMEPPDANKAKRKVNFALSSLSEQQQELIEDVANAIALCRSGCFSSEQTIDILYENFVGYDYDYLKYLPDIESGSASPQSLAEHIYEDTQEEAPVIIDDDAEEENEEKAEGEDEDDDDQEDKDEDDEQILIREVAESIYLCRSGRRTSEQTVDVLCDRFIGYDNNYFNYLPEITSGSMSPKSLAKRIYEDIGTEATHGGDKVYRGKVEKPEHNTSDISQGEAVTRHESKLRKVSIKFKFDIKGRFQDIYRQVLTGHTLPQEALSMFRSAAEKPDISDKELAKLMVEHDVPFDVFFSCGQAEPEKQISNKSEEHFAAKSEINPVVGPLTPQDSRRTSKLLNHYPNPSSVNRFAAPETPPDDSCPSGESEPGANLPSHISGNERTEMLIQALQKLVDPEPYDCPCIDDSSEEAELPNMFFEETPKLAVQHQGRENCSTIAISTTIARNSKADKGLRKSKSDVCITKDHASSLPDPVGQTSFLSRVSFALRPVTIASEVRMPHLVPGSSQRARVRHETDIGRKWDDSNPDLREHDRSDWEGCAQAAPGGPPDNYAFICEHSSSPECGETTALWGLAMPTSKARELGTKLGLKSNYVNENFRSSTPNRDAARKMSKISERRSIPYLKRKSDSLLNDHRMHKSRKGSEVILFAEDGDDQTRFIEKRLRAPTPMVPVKSLSRCETCNSCNCSCRQLEICQLEMRSVGVLPSIEPSDPSTGSGVQSISGNEEFERTCRALATYTPPVEEPRGKSGRLDNDDVLLQMIHPAVVLTRQTCLPSAHGEGHLAHSSMAEKESPFSAKSGKITESNTIGTQGTPDPVKELVKWKIDWKATDGDGNDTLSQGEEVSPKEQSSPIQDVETAVLHPKAHKLSLLLSSSSIGQPLSSGQRDTTKLSPTDQHLPILLFDNSINERAGKVNNSDLAVEAISELQSTSRSIRNVSISTAFLPLTISGLLEEIQTPAQNPNVSPEMTGEHTAQPAVVTRRCSVVTTMKSLTIDDKEISLPASSDSQPRPSVHTESNSFDCTVEHIEDLSTTSLSSGMCSSSLPNSRYGAPRPAVIAENRPGYTTMQVVEVESEDLPEPSALSAESTSTSNSMVSMVEHIETPSAGSISPNTDTPLLYISPDIDAPIPVCPSSPRPAAARLPTSAPVSLKDNDSTNSRSAFLRSTSISDGLPRANKSEQAFYNPPSSSVSAPLKRRRAESKSSLIRPSARLRVSSPLLGSNVHQDHRHATDIQETHPTIDSVLSLSSSEPVSGPTNIGQGRRHTPMKSRLLAKMDRYLARVARLPEAEAQQIPPCTPDDVEAAAWKFGASPRVFLWSKRQDREQKNQQNANRTSYTRYFQNPSASTAKSGTTSSLNKLFDKYRDDPESPDTIGTAGTMKYLTDLTVSLDEPAVLAILTELSAPTMGELTRDGFLAGWRALGADSLPKQTTALPHLRAQLSTNPDYFRRVYKHTFLLARTPGQKGVGLDTAVEFWRLLFGRSGVEWRGRDGTDWLGLWCGFVAERWKKSVSKDMWDQTGAFALKSLEDGSMAWWSEDGAWPGVLDEFVVFVRERRGEGGEGMDVE